MCRHAKPRPVFHRPGFIGRDIFMTSLGPNVENNWVFCLLVGLFLFLSTDNFVGVLALDDEVSLSGVAFNVTQGTLWASLENSSSEMAAPSGPARLLRARACGTATGCLGKRVWCPLGGAGPPRATPLWPRTGSPSAGLVGSLRTCPRGVPHRPLLLRLLLLAHRQGFRTRRERNMPSRSSSG